MAEEAQNPDPRQKLVDWLVKFGIDQNVIQTYTDEEIEKSSKDLKDFFRNVVVVPYKIESGDEELILEAKLTTMGDWIKVKLLLLRSDEVPKAIKLDLYERLLVANFELSEVTYSLDLDGDVFVETDMPVGTTYENFESEYGSVEFGAKYFIDEILPAMTEKLAVKSTFDSSHSLYI
ncbi:MAG: hypothetical protein ACTSU5_04610 [Promethearchaeota archaeon]